MYNLDERLTLEVKFIEREECGQKTYEDKEGNKFVWYTNSNKIEDEDWVKISAKLYARLDKDKNIKCYILYNPRKLK